MDIGGRLKALRDALGLTQAQFAARIGLPKATLVGYEVGQRKPGADALAAISRSGVNMTWLLTGEGDMFARSSPRESAEDARPSGTQLLPRSHPRAKRWDHLIRLVEQLEDEERRDAVLSELFARAQDAAQIDELQRAVRELRAARGR
jgi:transcriptional regulator with XRE-family HTH domain